MIKKKGRVIVGGGGGSMYNGNDHFVTFVPFLVFVFHLDVNM